MSTILPTTAEQLFNKGDDGNRYELISGELCMMSPSGWKHGEVVGTLHTLLGSFIREHKLGKIFGAETGFQIAQNPDTVRAPDIAFIAKENVPKTEPQEGFWPGAPDLAIEVLSPSDRDSNVQQKTMAWLDAGVKQVWLVDPQQKTIHVYNSVDVMILFVAEQKLSGLEILPGFSCELSEVFKA